MNAEQREAILIVTAAERIDVAAAGLAEKLNLSVELASTQAAALRLLGRRAYTAVVVDEILTAGDPAGADLLWKNAGLAIPLQFSFALSGTARLERELRAAIARRRHEQQLAALAAAATLDMALKDAVTGFLLESRLALGEENIPPSLAARLRTMEAAAERLRARLSDAPVGGVAAAVRA